MKIIQKHFENFNPTLVALLIVFHIFVIAVSNYLSTVRLNLFPEKIFWSHIEINVQIVAALFAFPLVIIGTDLNNRLFGKKNGKKILSWARIPAIIIAVLALYIMQNEHAFRVGLASISAYVISTLFDKHIIQRLMNKFPNTLLSNPFFILIVANIVQSYTFFYIAFFPNTWVHQLAMNMTFLKIFVSLIAYLPWYKSTMTVLENYCKKKFN